MTVPGPAHFPLTPDVVRLVGGGYLRNTIREPWVTCRVCTRPVNGYLDCYQCDRQPGLADGFRLASQVLPVVYAVNGVPDRGQSAHLLRAYKHPQMTTQMLRTQVAFLVALALQEHGGCMERAVGRARMSAWTTVPSTRERPGVHPLVFAVQSGGFAPGHRVEFAPGPTVNAPAHTLAPRRWIAADPDAVAGRHVLVIDDTWTSGANAQSAAAALTAAGADDVTVLAVARWINNDRYAEAFIRERLHAPGVPDYSPRVCPVTGGPCPP